MPKLKKTWTAMYTNEPMAGVTKLTEQQLGLVLGGEACMWAEYIDGSQLLNTMWPRGGGAALITTTRGRRGGCQAEAGAISIPVAKAWDSCRCARLSSAKVRGTGCQKLGSRPMGAWAVVWPSTCNTTQRPYQYMHPCHACN